MIRFYDLKCPNRTQGNAAVAVDALGVIRNHPIQILIVAVHFICALPFTDTAGDTFIRIPDYLIIRIQKIN